MSKHRLSTYGPTLQQINRLAHRMSPRQMRPSWKNVSSHQALSPHLSQMPRRLLQNLFHFLSHLKPKSMSYLFTLHLQWRHLRHRQGQLFRSQRLSRQHVQVQFRLMFAKQRHLYSIIVAAVALIKLITTTIIIIQYKWLEKAAISRSIRWM